MKSILLSIFFVVVPFNVFEKSCPPSKVTMFSYVIYKFYVPILKHGVFNVPTIHSVFCETEFYPTLQLSQVHLLFIVKRSFFLTDF